VASSQQLIPFIEQGGSMTIKELEQIEDRARRGLPIDSEVILTLTAYLREVLQAKVNAEAVAHEARCLNDANASLRNEANRLHLVRLSRHRGSLYLP
jgi:hypothetical protein